MTRHGVLAAALVALALFADAASFSSLAFYLLLGAIPLLVVCALATLERLLDERARLACLVLQVAALAFVLLAAAARAPLRAEGTVPRLAVSAAVASLVALALQWLVGALPSLRRAPARAAPEL